MRAPVVDKLDNCSNNLMKSKILVNLEMKVCVCVNDRLNYRKKVSKVQQL